MRRLGVDFRGSPTQRLLFRKVEKAWDEKDFELALLKQKVEALEAQVEALKPSRRRRVRPDPNELFVGIEQIHRAQIEASRIEEGSNEESNGESSESEASCIVVAVGSG